MEYALCRIGSKASHYVDSLHERLSTEDLDRLCQRKVDGAHAVREHILEDIFDDVAALRFGRNQVYKRKYLRKLLGFTEGAFPSRCFPDSVINVDGRFDVYELKSNRIDYARPDRVVGKAFRQYLDSINHRGSDPSEVEQDLIKLHRYREVFDAIGSCTFLMVDACFTQKLAWTTVFSDRATFESVMQTDLVRSWSDDIVDRTIIRRVESGSMIANLISYRHDHLKEWRCDKCHGRLASPRSTKI